MIITNINCTIPGDVQKLPKNSTITNEILYLERRIVLIMFGGRAVAPDELSMHYGDEAFFEITSSTLIIGFFKKIVIEILWNYIRCLQFILARTHNNLHRNKSENLSVTGNIKS